MCRFLRLRPCKFSSPQLRSQRLSRASVSDRNRKLLPDHLTPFVICERVHCAAVMRGFLGRPAGPFLPGTGAEILVRARRRAVRCYRPVHGYPEGDARYKARRRFQMRSAVAGATHLVTSTAAPMHVTRSEFSI